MLMVKTAMKTVILGWQQAALPPVLPAQPLAAAHGQTPSLWLARRLSNPLKQQGC